MMRGGRRERLKEIGNFLGSCLTDSRPLSEGKEDTTRDHAPLQNPELRRRRTAGGEMEAKMGNSRTWNPLMRVEGKTEPLIKNSPL